MELAASSRRPEAEEPSVTAFITGFTSDSIHPETRYDWTVVDVEYQRNGVSGYEFHHIKFHRPLIDGHDDVYGYLLLQAIVFELPGHVAVFDPITGSNRFRGDNFERGLREVIAAWHKRGDL